MKIYTVGFTKKSAEAFFTSLRASGARHVLDVRLNNVSQLAGFSKRDDLRFFLREVAGIGYEHRLDLAPTQDLLDGYRKQHGAWAAYERGYLDLIAARRIQDTLAPETVADSCLLCSEALPHHCHRRLVAEYLADKWGGVEIVHLP